MTSFGYWQAEANKAGLFMCMICFESFPIDQAYTDSNGDKWDSCVSCEEIEKELLRRKVSNVD